ncbi:aldehyde dehydrogenase family protein [Mycolicibacterium goodii]|uniref:aldehyde dehydrogenase family protein n=1 Tax=Mycolicibacterium goodii TaxID=134601 RepID=UPI001BDBD374|nr:aldehyde dehydrogenase family protein [Mycolicibacterium goodii]MBU8832874.1 aldehyde dehydrogenase family protein [Mycolicibacterium goodii]
MISRYSHFIDGCWIDTGDHDGQTLSVENPATTETIAYILRGGSDAVHRAVSAAQRAFSTWSATEPSTRAAYLRALADKVEENAESFAQTICAEVGTPIRIAREVQTALPIRVLRRTADLVNDTIFVREIGNSLVEDIPVGVVAAITPWNYPLHQIIAKLAPAIGAGCTVVLKPSEVAPINALMLAEAVAAVGLPPGVVNIVTGTGAEAGAALAAHPGIDMISFTGSVSGGAAVSRAAAENVVRTALELGGKSASVILPSADLTTAVKVGLANCFLNSGQTCSAWTRMLVPRNAYYAVLDSIKALLARYGPSDPSDDNSRLGPVVSAVQLRRVQHFIGDALARGAHRVEPETPFVLPSAGHFVEPTVLFDVAESDPVFQEEVFGPVLVVHPYDDVDDAARLANCTQYGLAGGVWAATDDEALAFARRLRTGQIDINGGPFNPDAPFGGFKRSGHGRELGPIGLAEYLTTRSAQLRPGSELLRATAH